MIEYLFGLGSTHLIRAFSPHCISSTMFQESSRCLMCTHNLFPPNNLVSVFFFNKEWWSLCSVSTPGGDWPRSVYTLLHLCCVSETLASLSLFLSPPLFLLFLFFFCLPFLLLLLLWWSCHSRTPSVCAGAKPGDNLNDRHTDILRLFSPLSQTDLLSLGQVETLYLSINGYSFQMLPRLSQ